MEDNLRKKVQTAHCGAVVVRYELGATWFDGALQVWPVGGGPDAAIRIEGTDTIVALRDFLNSLDFSGRRLTLVKSG